MKKVILTSAISLLTAMAAQADYQFETNLGYVQGDFEEEFDGDSSSVDVDGFTLGASIYFDTVDTSKGPLREAAFLSKSSDVSLGYITVEADVDGSESIDTTTVSLRVVLENDFIVEAAYTDIDEDSGFGIGVGKYLSDNSEVIVSFNTTDESETDTLGVDYHALRDLSGTAAISYDLGVSYIDDSVDSGFGVLGGLTYYPSSQLGFGASIGLNSVGDSDTTTIALNAEYFFNESVAASLSYGSVEQEIDSTSDTAELIIIGLTGRF